MFAEFGNVLWVIHKEKKKKKDSQEILLTMNNSTTLNMNAELHLTLSWRLFMAL